MAKAVAVIQMVAEGETVHLACELQFISVASFRSGLKKEVALQEMLDEALRYRNDTLSDMLVNIDKHHSDARMASVISKNIQWVLERNEPEKFGARVTIHGGTEASAALAEALNKAIDRIPVPRGTLVLDNPRVTDVTFVDATPKPASMDELKKLGLI